VNAFVPRSIFAALVSATLALSATGCDEKKENTEDAAARIAKRVTEADTRLRNNKLGDAEKIYTAILKEQPGHPGATGGLGKVRFEQDQFAEAEVLLSKALETNKKDAVLWAALGRAREHQDKHAEAAEAYGEAQAIDPEDTDVGLSWGRELKRAGKLTEAEPVLRKVAEEDPMVKHVHTELADVLRAQGKLDEALRMYMKAQNTYRSDRMARAGAALVYEAKGDTKHALDEWSGYIRMDCCSDYSNDVAKKKMMELEAPKGAADGGAADGGAAADGGTPKAPPAG